MNKKAELIRLSDELCAKIDSDYQQLLGKTNFPLKKLSEEISEKLREYKKGSDNLTNFYLANENELNKEVNISEFIKLIVSHESKTIFLNICLREILKRKDCYQCKKQLPNELWIYSRKDNKAKEWKISNPCGDWEDWDNPILFCSENCFKQSIYFSRESSNRKKPDNKDEKAKKIVKEKKESKSRLEQLLIEKDILEKRIEFADNEALKFRLKTLLKEQKEDILEQKKNLNHMKHLELGIEKSNLIIDIKSNYNDDNDNIRERERERETKISAFVQKLLDWISELENKPNRDELDEEHLAERKKWLEEIKSLQFKSSKEEEQSIWKDPIFWGLGIFCLIMLILSIFYYFRRKKIKK